eukprot:scaffold29337_cov178-Isochrysis_galbana.AAC.1
MPHGRHPVFHVSVGEDPQPPPDVFSFSAGGSGGACSGEGAVRPKRAKAVACAMRAARRSSKRSNPCQHSAPFMIHDHAFLYIQIYTPSPLSNQRHPPHQALGPEVLVSLTWGASLLHGGADRAP